MNEPHSALAHLGCAICVLIAALSGSVATHFPGFQQWMLEHYFIMPLVFLALLTAAWLLEHALTTGAILLLLGASAICGGLVLGGFSLVGASLVWQMTAGPLCYFAAAALVLHRWSGKLYRWQLCCIFTLAGILGAALVSGLTAESPVSTICALLLTCTVATFELIVFFSKGYFEITSESRTRSTVLAILMLQALPVYKTLWYFFITSRHGVYGAGRFIFNWFRWM